MLPLASNLSPSTVAESKINDNRAPEKMNGTAIHHDQPIILQTESLTKKYGDRVALSNLNLTVRAREVFGYVGPNGAGKTTTFRILAGLLDPSSGVARIDGQDVTGNRDRIKQLVGYLPDNFGVYPQLRVLEYLDFFAAAYRIPKKQRKQRIDFCLEIANANEFREKLMGSLSRGMKQRVGIAKTLLHDPSVLILDEPAATLDPRARVQMRVLLRKLADAGKAVLVSSHILPELGDMCDTIGILSGGQVVAYGAVKDVLSQVRSTRLIEIRVLGSAALLHEILTRAEGSWKLVSGNELDRNLGVTMVRYEIEADAQQMAAGLQMLIGEGVNVVSFAELPVNLEDAFMHLTK
jgi:ABC-2 type transport system ATP-binding protein